MEVAVPYFDAAPACGSYEDEEQPNEGLIDAMDLIKHQFGVEQASHADHAAAEAEDDAYADPFGTRHAPDRQQCLISINDTQSPFAHFCVVFACNSFEIDSGGGGV